ncbi:MAG: cation:proton antiporter [Fimbriimonadales bacterium]|nr:cation:proton antiporter [Fimbriimonadales bacterium]
MATGWRVILDFVLVLGIAFVAGAVAEKLHLSSVLGYLLAGLFVGPRAFGLIEGGEELATLGELGVALFLFSIGLEFSWSKLRRLGPVALGGGTLGVAATTLAGALIGVAFGLGWIQGVVAGLALALGSTAVVLRVLHERRQLDAPFARLAFGVLILQDALLLPIMLTVTFLVAPQPSVTALGALLSAALVFSKVLLASGLLFLLTGKVLPRFYDSRTLAQNRELAILLATVTCVGSAWAAHMLGLTPALGAFVAGMLLAGTPYAVQIRADIGPLRAIFVTMFFTTVGMMVDGKWLMQNLPLVLCVAAAILMVKVVVAYGAFRLFRESILVSLAAAIATAQVGEFSFVLFQIARFAGFFDEVAHQLMTTSALATMIATPLFVPHSRSIARWLARRVVPARRLAGDEREHARESLKGHVVLVGFGESGQAAARPLLDARLQLLVLDVDARLVALARRRGLLARVGDATVYEVLKASRIEDARALAVSIPNHDSSRLIIETAKRLNPTIVIAARARYRADVQELAAAGADFVVDESNLTGQRLGASLVSVSIPEGVSLR